jgi:electron transfer flavoprotein alpha subunit
MILVIAEQREGKLARASWEPIVAAQQAGDPVRVVLLGHGLSAAATELTAAAVAEVLTVDQPELAAYTPDGYVHALMSVIAAEQPSMVYLSHTYQARDFAPKLAARLDRAILTDVVAIRSHGSGLAFVRPMFQAKLYAEVTPLGPEPHLVSFQAGAFRTDALVRAESAAPARNVPVDFAGTTIRQQPEPPFREAKQAVDLTQAERIVSVGRGIKGPEHLELAQRLANALGAELAASRPICDAGWLPMERQVGSSGQTVSPRLYLALGISGAIQHVVGMKGARTIVAINKDPDAPIFELADYGIAGDLFEIVPAMIEVLGGSS